jgi:hypothetical protein
MSRFHILINMWAPCYFEHMIILDTWPSFRKRQKQIRVKIRAAGWMMDHIGTSFLQAQQSTTPPRGHVNMGPTKPVRTVEGLGHGPPVSPSSNYAPLAVPLRSLPCSRLVVPNRRRESPDPSSTTSTGGARLEKSGLSAVIFSARPLLREFFLSVASIWSASGGRKGIPIWYAGWIAGPARGRCLDCPRPVMDRAELTTEQVSAWGLLTRFRFNCWCLLAASCRLCGICWVCGLVYWAALRGCSVVRRIHFANCHSTVLIDLLGKSL